MLIKKVISLTGLLILSSGYAGTVHSLHLMQERNCFYIPPLSERRASYARQVLGLDWNARGIIINVYSIPLLISYSKLL